MKTFASSCSVESSLQKQEVHCALIFMLMVVSKEISVEGIYKQGPSAALLSYTFACGRYKGFSPSISLELKSLPIV